MQPISIWAFLGKSLFRSAVDTAGFFGLNLKTVLTVAIPFAIGFGLHLKLRGTEATKHEMATSVILTVVPFFLIFSALYLYNLAQSPYKVYAEAMRTAGTAFDQEKSKNQTLTANVTTLQQKLDAKPEPTEKRIVVPSSPVEIQLQLDAYRLADQIENWWCGWDGGRIMAFPGATTGISDWERWTPPPNWNPQSQNREWDWHGMLKNEYRQKFQNKIDVMEGRFKSQGIVGVPDFRIEDANGPIGIRATIIYLRKSASDLAFKQPGQPR